MSKRKSAAPAATVVLHELNNKTFQHRIVVFKNGVADAGPWAHTPELAKHSMGYYANLEAASVLPMGIFRVSRVPGQIVEF